MGFNEARLHLVAPGWTPIFTRPDARSAMRTFNFLRDDLGHLDVGFTQVRDWLVTQAFSESDEDGAFVKNDIRADVYREAEAVITVRLSFEVFDTRRRRPPVTRDGLDQWHAFAISFAKVFDFRLLDLKRENLVGMTEFWRLLGAERVLEGCPFLPIQPEV